MVLKDSEFKERKRMCFKCDGFKETIRFRDAGSYYNLVKQLQQVVDQETMVLIAGTCGLGDIDRKKQWPNDYIEHTFQCTTCGMRFMLSAETYHGCGGSWNILRD